MCFLKEHTEVMATPLSRGRPNLNWRNKEKRRNKPDLTTPSSMGQKMTKKTVPLVKLAENSKRILCSTESNRYESMYNIQWNNPAGILRPII